MTDESLMQNVKHNNLDNVSVLYERHKDRVFRFFMFKSHNDEEWSEDGVQQVFYRIIKYRKSYRDGSNFLAWMFSIARNIYLQELKDKIRQENLRSVSGTEEPYVSENDDHETLRPAIALLPEVYREVLMMSKFLGLKYEEIAEINDCSVGVIKTRVFRAMKTLKINYLNMV